MREDKRERLALVAQGAEKPRQALTVACNVVTWACAVYTLGAGLTAAVPEEPRRTG